MPKGRRFVVLVSFVSVVGVVPALLKSTTQKPPFLQTQEQKNDPLYLKKEEFKQIPSRKVKPYKKKYSFDVDESTLSAPTRANKQKAQIHSEDLNIQSKEGVTVHKPWDFANHWDPRKDDQGRPWSPDADSVAGAAIRGAVPEKPEPFVGFGITKSIDTQKK